MNRPIFEMLSSIKNRNSLHMPAHFGKSLFEYGNLFELDTTELDITDNLYNPQNAIKEAEKLLSISAKAKNAYFLHDGSSAGVRTLLLYARHFGKKIIVPRLSHKSIYTSIAIYGLEPIFVKASYTDDNLAYTNTDDIIDTIEANRDACAIILTSPDYYGVCVDIKKIADFAHKNNILVFCDQAHGAHLNWSKTLQNAGFYGADAFVQSAHKTLACLTSNAWLLNNTLSCDLLLDCLQAVQTTSPSFINMMVMDDARAYMDKYADCEKITKLIKCFSKKLKHFKLSHDIWKRQGFILDENRLVIDCMGNGYIVQNELNKNSIDIEMADDRRIVCIISQKEEECKQQLDKLLEALNKIDCEFIKYENIDSLISSPKKVLEFSEAYFSKKEMVSLKDAEGRISACVAGLYPPGIPLIAWGEKIEKPVIELFIKSKDKCFGINDGKINCVRE